MCKLYGTNRKNVLRLPVMQKEKCHDFALFVTVRTGATAKMIKKCIFWNYRQGGQEFVESNKRRMFS